MTMQDSEYIRQQLSEVVDKVGVENLVQVVTDSAASCVRAGQLLMDRCVLKYWLIMGWFVLSVTALHATCVTYTGVLITGFPP